MFSIFFIPHFFKSIFNLTKQRYESKFTIMGKLFPIYEFKFTIMESLLPRQVLKKLPRRHEDTKNISYYFFSVLVTWWQQEKGWPQKAQN